MLYLIDNYEDIFEKHFNLDKTVSQLLTYDDLPVDFEAQYKALHDDFDLVYEAFENYLLIECNNKEKYINDEDIENYLTLFHDIIQELSDLCFNIQHHIISSPVDDLIDEWLLEFDDE